MTRTYLIYELWVDTWDDNIRHKSGWEAYKLARSEKEAKEFCESKGTYGECDKGYTGKFEGNQAFIYEEIDYIKKGG